MNESLFPYLEATVDSVTADLTYSPLTSRKASSKSGTDFVCLTLVVSLQTIE